MSEKILDLPPPDYRPTPVIAYFVVGDKRHLAQQWISDCLTLGFVWVAVPHYLQEHNPDCEGCESAGKEQE